MNLSTQDKEWIKELITQSHEGRISAIEQLQTDVQELRSTLKPISDAFDKGSVSFWFVKWIVSGIVIILSVALAVKQLK